MQVVVHVPQAVADHGVDQFAVAQAIAGAGLGQQVGGGRHVLRAAGHDHCGLAALDGLRGQHHRFQTRAAHLVDRGGADGDGQAGADGRLPGDVLAQARADHVAEDHFIDLVGRHAAAASAALMAVLPKSGGRNLRQGSLENRRSGCAHPPANHTSFSMGSNLSCLVVVRCL